MGARAILKVWLICTVILLTFTACSPAEGQEPAAQEGQQAENPPAAEQVQPTPPPAEGPTPPPTLVPTAPPSPVPPPPEVKHVDVPASTSGKVSTIHDHLTKDTAEDKQAYAGDDFTDDRFERPFTREMEYLPWLDIVDANMVREEPFFYFSLVMQERGFPGGGEPPVFGCEIDTDIDGRGDLLVQTLLPLEDQWGQREVTAWEDSNNDVGGETPVFSDTAFGGGDGYERLVFEAGRADDPDLAWSRLNPDDPTRVDLAFHSTYFAANQLFIWGCFADGFPGGPESFDLNDRFSLEEAGSAMKASKYYPLKNFFAFDNTCRTTSGFDPKGGEPGICANIVPPAPERVQQCNEVCPRQGPCATVCD